MLFLSAFLVLSGFVSISGLYYTIAMYILFPPSKKEDWTYLPSGFACGMATFMYFVVLYFFFCFMLYTKT